MLKFFKNLKHLLKTYNIYFLILIIFFTITALNLSKKGFLNKDN